MRIFTFEIIAAFLLFSMDGYSAAIQPTIVYAPLTGQAALNYDAAVSKAIANAEANVANLQNRATRQDLAPTWNSKLELQNAIIQLEVKKTLVGNFRNTESLQSPVVRDMLLRILNKDIITTADLADLQSTVLEEKANIRAAQAAAAAAAAQQNTPDATTTPATSPSGN